MSTVIACPRGFEDYQSALDSMDDDPMGGHAYRCVSCKRWHVKANISRVWVDGHTHARRGRKPKDFEPVDG